MDSKFNDPNPNDRRRRSDVFKVYFRATQLGQNACQRVLWERLLGLSGIRARCMPLL